MRYLMFVLLNSSLLLLVACTHTIYHAPYLAPTPPATTGPSGELTLVIPVTTAQQIIDKRIGLTFDKWKFEIGSSISDILPTALATRFAKVVTTSKPETTDPLVKVANEHCNLTVNFVDLSVDAGISYFSDHKVTLITNVQYQNNGAVIFNREFQSIGSASGSSQATTWAGLASSSLLVEGMNDALEVAVTNSIIMLADELIKSIEASGQSC